ncbi:hypothetical protein [Megalodesulfovibrio gigas]|uniref:hypothetical protein n=1 Tax=Megalodesulfovibrio gigas TaxID=879 RepID=UPI00042908F4|nr:hypothetical protein [Megalodesulfovibrio gigas]
MYSQSISYHELQEVEQALMAQIQDVLAQYDAVHLDFWGYGDLLRLECGLEQFDPEALADCCRELAAFLPDGVSARVLGIDKNLKQVAVFGLWPGVVRQEAVDLRELLGR